MPASNCNRALSRSLCVRNTRSRAPVEQALSCRCTDLPAAASWTSPLEISTVLEVAQGRDLLVNFKTRLLAGHPTIRGHTVEADQAAINQTITCLVYRLLESPVTVISLRRTTRHMPTVRHTLCIMNNVYVCL